MCGIPLYLLWWMFYSFLLHGKKNMQSGGLWPSVENLWWDGNLSGMFPSRLDRWKTSNEPIHCFLFVFFIIHLIISFHCLLLSSPVIFYMSKHNTDLAARHGHQFKAARVDWRDRGASGECAGHCIGSAAGSLLRHLIREWVFVHAARCLQMCATTAATHCGGPLDANDTFVLHPTPLLCVYDWVCFSSEQTALSAWAVDTEEVDNSDCGGGEYLRFMTCAVLHPSAAPMLTWGKTGAQYDAEMH